MKYCIPQLQRMKQLKANLGVHFPGIFYEGSQISILFIATTTTAHFSLYLMNKIRKRMLSGTTVNRESEIAFASKISGGIFTRELGLT